VAPRGFSLSTAADLCVCVTSCRYASHRAARVTQHTPMPYTDCYVCHRRLGTQGDEVRTATGEYRRVTRIWETDYSDPKRNSELVFLRGVWMTSHHPVLVGSCWRYPADLAPSFPGDPAFIIAVQGVALRSNSDGSPGRCCWHWKSV
jgi:hypothetical protein